ncbi:alpha/beta fold hydrolase [Anthocerotibacter panamensis]|uniref:alpha/beta fold hydrolase n=1 Tax=Anthocerotibacter panamensis TaxID=2857077 RepID=UPI001C406A2A|nr:alpha/beta hydrolase [Anthocerotibacter panamensis]
MVALSPRPLLLYLPGLDGTGKLFYQQEALLAPYCDVRILCIPLHDQSNWSQLTQLVFELLPKDRSQPVILCGESFGACIALQAATACPACFDKVVLINPATSWRRQTILSQGAHCLTLLPAVSCQFAALFFMPFLAAINRIRPKDRRVLLAILRLVPAETIVHRLRLLKEFDQDDQLPVLSMPVLLLAGRADRLLPSLDEALWLSKRIPDAQVQIMPYSGHALLIEQEVDLAQLLLQYGFLPN